MPGIRYRLHRAARSRYGAHWSDRGATAVEAALILPLLFVLTFGIVEFALLMRDHTATSEIVRAGARTASALPRDPTLMAATLSSIEREGSALPKSAYRELWIYKANAKGFPGAAGNADFGTGDCSSNCIRYRWDEKSGRFARLSGSDFTTRINACPGDDSSDAVGVYLLADHRWLTGLFATTTPVSDRAVVKFEPIGSDRPCKSW